MKIRLTIYGGFHNSKPITFNVPLSKVQDYMNDNIPLHELLTKRQNAIATKHFCGINGCKCGSYARANVEFEKK